MLTGAVASGTGAVTNEEFDAYAQGQFPEEDLGVRGGALEFSVLGF
jgi:hypothetical protein